MKLAKVIIQPEWFRHGLNAFRRSIKLYDKKQIPPSIELLMIEVPILHMLRGIHGKSNLGVAWDLLWRAIAEDIRLRREHIWIRMQYFWLRYVMRMSSIEAEQIIFEPEEPADPEFDEQLRRALTGE